MQRTTKAVFGWVFFFFFLRRTHLSFLDLVAGPGDWQGACQESDLKAVFRADGSLSVEAE